MINVLSDPVDLLDVPPNLQSLSNLHEQTIAFASAVAEPELSDSAHRLLELSADSDALSPELTITSLTAWLRNNPGLRVSFYFHADCKAS